MKEILRDAIGPIVILVIVLLFMTVYGCRVDQGFDELYKQQQEQQEQK